MKEGISEAASNKGKRGRPRKWADREWIGLLCDGTTRRAKMDAEYASVARRSLFAHVHEFPELSLLTGLLTDQDGRPFPDPRSNVAVLAQLGRLIHDYTDGNDAALELALEICRQRPRLSVKVA